jgi:translocation and assembly module TamB
MLRLGKESILAGAVVNEEVSTRVLSYVAPVLNETTQASGRVSVTLDRAEFPIGSPVGRKANVTGSVAFKDVEFTPGPLARMVYGLLGREPEIIRLDEPVLLSIADGRINQRGLAIPLARGAARIEIEGWVDFDKNLNLVATIPFTPEMLGGQTLASGLLSGGKVRLPIGGTLSAPKLDKDAFRNNLKDVGDTLLGNVAGAGAAELIKLLAKPRDPNAPPPMTPEQRKAQRIEKRNERRKAKGLDPLPVPGRKP